MKIKEKLEAEVLSELDDLGDGEFQSDEFELRVNSIKKLTDAIVDLEKIETDRELKKEQLKSEEKRQKVTNGITIGTTVVSTAVSVWAVAKTFKFDGEKIFTSTLGRNILNKFIPKK